MTVYINLWNCNWANRRISVLSLEKGTPVCFMICTYQKQKSPIRAYNLYMAMFKRCIGEKSKYTYWSRFTCVLVMDIRVKLYRKQVVLYQERLSYYQETFSCAIFIHKLPVSRFGETSSSCSRRCFSIAWNASRACRASFCYIYLEVLLIHLAKNIPLHADVQ